MRIISGKAKGTKLYTLEGNNTRPTLDRVKESLFNIIGEQILGVNFLDLFSGSGSIGLEAASRGAKEVILCDNSKEAVEIIKKNIKKVHLEDVVKVYNSNFDILLKEKINEVQDYIYIDPPYESDYFFQSVQLLLKNKRILNEESIIILETDDIERIKRQLENLDVEIIDNRKYGRAHLIFLKKSQLKN